MKGKVTDFKVRFRKDDGGYRDLGFYYAESPEDAIEKCLKEKQEPDLFIYKSKVEAVPLCQPNRMDIYVADMSGLLGDNKKRPVVVLSNDVGNKHSPNVIVACITSRDAKPLPTHMEIKLEEESIILTENIHTISKKRLISFVRKLSEEESKELEEKILISLGFITNWGQPVVNDNLPKILKLVGRINRALSKEYDILTNKDGDVVFLKEGSIVLSYGSSDEILIELNEIMLDLLTEELR